MTPQASEPPAGAPTTPAGEPVRTVHPAKAIFVASVGNALEWFDLIIFGFLSAQISQQFFPSENQTASLLATFATFAVAFFIRPLGAIVLGAYADTHGRMKALTLAAGLMMLGTAIIAFIPSYHTIGLAATAGLVIARLLQGFSAGGEFGSATAFLAEQNPKRRGFYASWQVASQGVTTVLAAGFGAGLSHFLSPQDLTDWGWRIPFFFGMLIGPVALYMRLFVPEPVEYQQTEPEKRPLRATFSAQKERLLTGVGVVILGTVGSYLILFMPGYAVRELGLPADGAFFAALVTGAVQFALSPIFGHLSDKHGRLKIMAAGGTAMLLLIYPLFAWLQASPTVGTMLVVQTIYGVMLAAYFSLTPALLADIFPVKTRTTGLSLAYNFSVTVFGGGAPFLITWLIAASGDMLAPSYYVVFASILSLIALVFAARRLKLR